MWYELLKTMVDAIDKYGGCGTASHIVAVEGGEYIFPVSMLIVLIIARHIIPVLDPMATHIISNYYTCVL